MFKSISILFAFAAAAAILVSGCGDNSSTASSDTPLSKPAYIEQADAICKESNNTEYKEALAYVRKHRGIEKLQFEDARERVRLEVALPAVEKETEELKALGMPTGSEQELEAFFAAIDKAVAETENDPKSVEDDAKNPFNAVAQLAREYGFKNCQEII